jgi:hypothetical protein
VFPKSKVGNQGFTPTLRGKVGHQGELCPLGENLSPGEKTLFATPFFQSEECVLHWGDGRGGAAKESSWDRCYNF